MVLKEGSGDKPAPGTMINAHYTGTFIDGRKFDSSLDRGEPFRFPVGTGRVIKGWDEALLDMKKDEKRILIIPPDLAYDSQQRGPIPPNLTLVFEVGLVDFKKGIREEKLYSSLTAALTYIDRQLLLVPQSAYIGSQEQARQY